MKQSVPFRERALSVVAICASVVAGLAVESTIAGLRQANMFAEKARQTYKRRMAPRRNASRIRKIISRLPR